MCRIVVRVIQTISESTVSVIMTTIYMARITRPYCYTRTPHGHLRNGISLSKQMIFEPRFLRVLYTGSVNPHDSGWKTVPCMHLQSMF